MKKKSKDIAVKVIAWVAALMIVMTALLPMFSALNV